MLSEICGENAQAAGPISRKFAKYPGVGPGPVPRLRFALAIDPLAMGDTSPAMTNPSELDSVEITEPGQLWDWLAEYHGGPSIWLTTWKAAHRDKYVSREEVLDALVAYGWIDGRRLKLDDDRTMQLIAPRKQQAWARTYKARADRLIAEGRMQAPGLASVEAGKASGQWTWSDPVDDLVVPEDLRAALDAAMASAWFDQAAPSYRRNVLRYLANAKREATRAKRIAQLAGFSARSERLPNY